MGFVHVRQIFYAMSYIPGPMIYLQCKTEISSKTLYFMIRGGKRQCGTVPTCEARERLEPQKGTFAQDCSSSGLRFFQIEFCRTLRSERGPFRISSRNCDLDNNVNFQMHHCSIRMCLARPTKLVFVLQSGSLCTSHRRRHPLPSA